VIHRRLVGGALMRERSHDSHLVHLPREQWHLLADFDARYVRERLSDIVKSEDLSRYIL